MAFRIKMPLSLKLRIKGNVKAIDVYHGLQERIGSGPKVLRGLVHVTGDLWNVTVANEEVKQKLLNEDLVLNGVNCPVYEVEQSRTLVKVKSPYEIPDERIGAALKQIVPQDLDTESSGDEDDIAVAMDDSGNKDDEDMNNDDHDNEQGDNDRKDDSDDDTDDSLRLRMIVKWLMGIRDVGQEG
ncbi:uncharacterized protein LOC135466885 [Liolophura sinensis]|uniref:uncharacterized protein LOC135466885 n=1 Tax=Liolophura sinensis TaxID=3198878 RepID=UPI00315896F5